MAEICRTGFGESPIYAALAALAHAQTKTDYRKAKLLVAKLPPLGQLAMVDAIRACRARLLFDGVQL